MELHTVEDVADQLHVKPATVRQWLRIGKLAGCKVGRRWLVTNDELLASIEGRMSTIVDKSPAVATLLPIGNIPAPVPSPQATGRRLKPRIIG